MADLTQIEGTIDVFCIEDMLPDMPAVSGRTACAHRLARRLTTPRGRFPWWPKFGTDLRAYLLSKATPEAIASAAEFECLKDEQVDRVKVRAEVQDSGRRIHLVIEVTDAAGPYVFTLTITTAAATLIQLQNAA
jgi:hypothetical protein